MFETLITHKLNITYPIFQAPMAGGPTTPELVAAVLNAGGLGNLGAGYLTPEQLRNTINKIRGLTDRPFGINLFVFEQPEESEETIAKMSDYLNSYRNELGIPHNPSLPKYSESFEDQIQVVLEERVPVFSFTFGLPSHNVIQSLKHRGTFVIGTATTVDEAIQLELSGIDAIVAQGSEAGGHRGTFLKNASDSLIGLIALVPQIVDHVSIPVIASGGIMDGRGLVASLALGATAVQMGTAFLACTESGAYPTYKQKILSANEDATVITCAYSGKSARGISTEFIRDMQLYPGNIPPYPIQHVMTRDIRQAAAIAKDPEFMSLWAGQGLRLANNQSAATIINETIDQARKLVIKSF